VADFSDMQIQMTLTVAEMKDLVLLTNLAAEVLPEGQAPDIVEEISTMYFELMENLKDGFLGDFQPE
jgi:hypothetical protein